MIVLLVARLTDFPRRLPGIDLIFSCGQYPGAFDGLKCAEVHVDENASTHPHFDKVAATLARNLERARR